MTIGKMLRALDVAREYHDFTDKDEICLLGSPLTLENCVQFTAEDQRAKTRIVVKISLDSPVLNYIAEDA